MNACAVVLVEGISDERALASWRKRRGRDLEAEGVSPADRWRTRDRYDLERFGPRGLDLKPRRSLRRRGGRHLPTRIRARGTGRISDSRATWKISASSSASLIWRTSLSARSAPLPSCASSKPRANSAPFRTFQKQPAKRGLRLDEQLGASCGTGRSDTRRYWSKHSISAAPPSARRPPRPPLTASWRD